MKKLNIELEGMAPLLMHNGQLADPLNSFARQMKEISSIRIKTDEHHRQMATIEARGGLYVDEDNKICIPGQMIHASVINGGKFQKLGTALKRAFRVIEQSCEFDYEGPTDPDSYIKAPGNTFRALVGVQTSRIARTRPIFTKWSVRFTALLDEEQVNAKDFMRAVEDAGTMVGLGDWRPRFGTFKAKLKG